MGFEYIIRYCPVDEIAWRAFVDQLDNPTQHGWSAFDVDLTTNGIYFCDHGRTSQAAIAFRQIIDEALKHGNSVMVTEAE